MSTTTNSRWNPFRHHVVNLKAEETSLPQASLPATKSKIWETTVERVESWPEEARPLKKHTWLTFLYGLGDFILVLLPIYFIRKYTYTMGMC